MTLEQRLRDLINSIGSKLKPLITGQGDLSTLATTNKDSLVDAINELSGLIGTGGESSVINDAATSGTAETYSVNKILMLLNGLRDEIMGEDVSAAMNSFREIQDALEADETVTSALVTAMAKRVSVSSAQAFTAEEKEQGRANLGAYGATEIGNPDTDLVALLNSALA
jgi:hypothetical protein